MYMLGYISSNIFPLINSLLNPIILILRGTNLRAYVATLLGLKPVRVKADKNCISTSKDLETFRPSNITAPSETAKESEVI